MRHISRVFLKGLVAMIPLVVTLWAVIWLVVTAEALLGGPMAAVLPEGFYIRGMGVVAGLATVFCVGLLLNVVIVRVIFHRFEGMLNRLPLVKSVYGAVKDLLSFFMSDSNKGQQVVMVTLWPEQAVPQLSPAAAGGASPGQPPAYAPPRVPMKLLGLVTRTAFDDLPAGVGDEESVAVYLPMSYQLGGFTVIVKRWQIEPVAMSTEDALRFAITAGINAKKPDPQAVTAEPLPSEKA